MLEVIRKKGQVLPVKMPQLCFAIHITLFNSGLIGEKSSRVVVQRIYNNKTKKKYVVAVAMASDR